MELDNFILKEFQNFNNEHINIINELKVNEEIKKYLGNLDFMINAINKRKIENICNNIFIAYYNDYPIGIITLTYFDDTYQISYGILNKFRKQNLASLLLQEFSEKVFEIYDIEKLVLKINSDNIGSQKVALLAGYEKENINTFYINKNYHKR